MNNKQILLASPHMSSDGWEQQYINEAFDTNWIAPQGANITCFEQELAQRVKTSAAVALNSGTSALHLALKAVGVGQGDVVICSSLTFTASANPICYQGATPIFVDSEHETWNMCPKALAEALHRYPNAKAVIVVHLYGIPANMNAIKMICDQYQVPIIEDAAESLGSTYAGIATGTIGALGAYSFNGNKIITTSGGGMLVSHKSDLIDKARFWATQAREAVRHYEHQEIGYNYRMSNISAGIGRGQLRVLTERVQQKRCLFQRYRELLGEVAEIQWMPEPADAVNNYWLTCITLAKTAPLRVIEALAEQQIESRPLWKPMHLQPVFADCDYFGGQVSTDLFQRGLCLPSDTKMTDQDLERVVQTVKKVLLGDKR